MIGLALTPEQYKTLLAMVYIANTVVNGRSEGDYLKEYDELEQYIFSRAKDAGFPLATWKHKEGGDEHHHPSRAFESDPELNKIIDSYDAFVLVELLAEKMAELEMERTYGANAKEELGEIEFDTQFELRTEKFAKEFDDFGFTRLEIKEK